MPRFVLLYHDCPPSYERLSHWDLMFESSDVLRTWALGRLPGNWEAAQSRTAKMYPNCPSIAAGNDVIATLLGEHRREYLDLEGPLSGNRGSVIRIAAGTYSGEMESPDYWRIALTGDELPGTLVLRRSNSDSSQWILECWPAG